ncbi:class I SAM-dependent methyltransferase [Croceiramulus getboli]|nr:class I SAM-dependent methyltransferase [Flavobacteriaceae bacterium YJPT1-3]
MTCCSLCDHPTLPYYEDDQRSWSRCTQCEAILLDSQHHLTAAEEHQRYDLHHNDVFDPRYRQFTNPISSAVCNDFQKDALGLDYGCGPGPVIAQVLKERGYTIELYDPFYHKDDSVLQLTYDFIVCSEVVEHFFEAKSEFHRLQSLLKPQGKLYIMTALFDANTIDFSDWYYKDDPTHVIFYTLKTFDYIEGAFGFSSHCVSDRLITFDKII